MELVLDCCCGEVRARISMQVMDFESTMNSIMQQEGSGLRSGLGLDLRGLSSTLRPFLPRVGLAQRA